MRNTTKSIPSLKRGPSICHQINGRLIAIRKKNARQWNDQLLLIKLVRYSPCLEFFLFFFFFFFFRFSPRHVSIVVYCLWQSASVFSRNFAQESRMQFLTVVPYRYESWEPGHRLVNFKITAKRLFADCGAMSWSFWYADF